MRSDREAARSAPADERAVEEGRLTIERAEEAWQRQVQSEESTAIAARSKVLRLVLLVAAAIAFVFLLLQQVVQIG